MKCTLQTINLNAKKRSENGKTYSGVEVTYQGEPYKGQAKEPTTRFLFSDNPVAKALADYKAGDKVEITFGTDKWKTPTDIRKLSATEGATHSAPQSTGNRTYGQQDPDTQKRIARAVAIKEGSALVFEMIKAGAFAASKTKSMEFLAEQVLSAAKLYEPYLSCTDQEDKVDRPELSPDDFDQDGFDD
jgi:hypothetical protein